MCQNSGLREIFIRTPAGVCVCSVGFMVSDKFIASLNQSPCGIIRIIVSRMRSATYEDTTHLRCIYIDKADAFVRHPHVPIYRYDTYKYLYNHIYSDINCTIHSDPSRILIEPDRYKERKTEVYRPETNMNIDRPETNSSR